MLLYQILAYTIHGKIQKNDTKTINLKYQLLHGMRNLNYLIDHILCQIFKIILTISSKNMNKSTYANNIENRITFKVKIVLSRNFNA